MSGIAGIIYHDGRPLESSRLERISESLAHRGSDGSGIWHEDSAGLVHRMLWTTPESLNEKLPRVHSSGGWIITADARIDNRDDLAHQLELPLSTAISDSELILAAYEKWGDECPEKLIGDFSFAIWDKRERRLFAARDRIGVKPFYYHHREGKVFAFSSEISPLFQAADLEKRPDEDAIRELIATLATAYEATLFKEIKRLPPACSLTLCAGNLALRRYWEPVSAQGRRKPDLARHIEEFRYLLSEAVKAQLRSAFPVGCLLSGGVDSPSVLCMAAHLIPDKTRLSSYSMIFDRLPCDEREFIEQAVRAAGVESIFTVADADPIEGWNGLRDCYGPRLDWPIQGTPMRALWPLLDEARNRGARVMLTGVGGDNVAQGSPYYLADLLTSFCWTALNKELKRHRYSRHVLWFWMLEALLPEWACKLGRRMRELAQQQSDASLLDQQAMEAAMKALPIARTRFATASAWQETSYIVNQAISMSLDGAWDDLGHRGNLEFRHPFYDARVVELLLSVPSEEKWREGTTKYILRAAMKDLLPESIRLRTGKAEFSPVIASALDSMAFDSSSFCLARMGMIEACKLEKVVKYQAARKTPLSSLVLWRLAALETWFNFHFNP